MKTPIADFIDSYVESGTVRFHMPGHKGYGDIEKYDITEIEGADVLYSADGIINESESNATSLFETSHTYYSAEGSTLAIKAMLMLATTEKKGKILAARNVHKAFLYGCAMLDLSVDWLYGQGFSHICSSPITKEDVEEALNRPDAQYSAVYVTSPDYLGNIADIEGIAKVCKKAGVPLLVDNAHGAYLKFLSSSLHPIDMGAAMCTDSAHKTLPVLTGGAYLHISKDYPDFCRGARNALSIFASTSPSYLILRSLDICNKHLSTSYKEKLSETIEMTDRTKAALLSMGIPTEKSEPLKIVLNCKRLGCSGDEISEILRDNKIECEFADKDYLVLMVSTKSTENDHKRLVNAFATVEARTPTIEETVPFSRPERALSIREALFAASEEVNAENSVGRICASPSVSCPPAVPIAVCGEIIGKAEADLFKKYGIDKVNVVKR